MIWRGTHSLTTCDVYQSKNLTMRSRELPQISEMGLYQHRHLIPGKQNHVNHIMIKVLHNRNPLLIKRHIASTCRNNKIIWSDGTKELLDHP